MSLLNIASDGLPNVLVVLYATTARARVPLTRDDLIETVAPKGVVHEDAKMVRQTLNRWIELGLFNEVNSTITLASPPESELRDHAEVMLAVRKAARRCALSQENNSDLWASQGARAADLTRSLAWLLAQDVYRIAFRNLEELELAQVTDSSVRLMQNDTRRNGLQFWGHFLGFVRQSGGGDVDPTVAIRETFPECIGPGEEMPAADFIARLADALPVLDGGQWRLAVESRLEPAALPTMSEGQLSSSLSRALINLMLEESLEFQNRADVGRSIVFTGRDGLRADYRYSWIRRPKAKTRRAR
jgi:hypothetical protein